MNSSQCELAAFKFPNITNFDVGSSDPSSIRHVMSLQRGFSPLSFYCLLGVFERKRYTQLYVL